MVQLQAWMAAAGAVPALIFARATSNRGKIAAEDFEEGGCAVTM